MELEEGENTPPQPCTEIVSSQIPTATKEGHGCNITNEDEQAHRQGWNEIFVTVNVIAAAVEKLSTIVEGLENQINVLQKTSTAMMGSLTMIETALCSREEGYGFQTTADPYNHIGSLAQSDTSHVAGNNPLTTQTRTQFRSPKTKHADDINNVVLDVSDGDDDFRITGPALGSQRRLPNGHKILTSKLSVHSEREKSILKQWTSTKPPQSEQPSTKSEIVGRKLFQNSCPSNPPSKLQKTDNTRFFSLPKEYPVWNKETKPKLNIGSRNAPNCSVGFKSISSFGPSLNRMALAGTKTTFPVGPTMTLTEFHSWVAAYVFSSDRDPGEVLVKFGDATLTRQGVECLCPGNIVSDEIIMLFVMKATWMQQHTPMPNIWCIPPSFADDVGRGETIDNLLAKYVKPWMQPIPNLKYVYVPIKEDGKHWYLMVISLQERIIYHLDSNLAAEKVNTRKQKIRALGEVISQMMCSDYYPRQCYGYANQFLQWDIMDGRGIPISGHSDNSALWVLSWIDMEHAFQPNFYGELNDNLVRMRTALSLLLAPCNEKKKWIESRASALMTSCPAPSTT